MENFRQQQTGFDCKEEVSNTTPNNITKERSGFDGMIVVPNDISNSTTKTQMINKLEHLLSTYTSEKISFNDDLEKIIKNIKRRRKEFDATKFFVLVVGPVKSGKSTLVNIFARDYVSPTAYKECTALPTIIGKSTGEHLNKIVQYIPTTKYDTDEEKKVTFDYIVDIIRGIEDLNVLEGRVSINTDTLSEDNVKRIITLYHGNNDNKSDLVVSIGIKGGGFIDDEIMLIDMPGLDGSIKNEENITVYQNMAQRADVVFFVQSTTSSLNKASIDFLKKLFDNKAEVPIWLIHNLHDSQYFLIDDKGKEKDIEEQLSIGKERIKKDFGINEFDDKVLNLGKINAAIHEKDRIDESYKENLETTLKEFEDFEKDLIRTLKDKRQSIKDGVCIGKANDVINESISKIEEIIKDITEKINNIENNIEAIKNLSGLIDKTNINGANVLIAYNNLLNSENIKSSWKVRIDDLFGSYSQRTSFNFNGRIRGIDLNRELIGFAQDCVNAIPIKRGSTFRTNLEHSILSELKPINDTITEIEDYLKTLTSTNISIQVDINKIISDNLTTDISEYNQTYLARNTRTILGITFDIRYNATTTREYLRDARDYFKLDTTIDIKLNDYREKISDNFITIRDKYKEKIKSIVEENTSSYEEKQKSVIEELKKNIKTINEFLNDLKRNNYE